MSVKTCVKMVGLVMGINDLHVLHGVKQQVVELVCGKHKEGLTFSCIVCCLWSRIGEKLHVLCQGFRKRLQKNI